MFSDDLVELCRLKHLGDIALIEFFEEVSRVALA